VAAAYVKKDAVPVEVADIRDASEPAALPDWRLEQLGLRPVGDELQSRKHVWAVPPGENGWIRWLEEFFDRQRGEVKGRLQKEAARP
jgi:polar amino acid transport system substrate-binding protein